MTDDGKNLIDKVDDITVVNFMVNECPLTLLKKFKAYAKEHTRMNYPLAIKRLLESAEANAKEAMIWENIMELKDRVTLLESSKTDSTVKPRIPTIGKTNKRTD